ncbi:hypothetical protein QWJ07_16740 [Frankia sp. RB7]|nr:hypothetical protein [Frankia sp. RB7]
MTANACAWSARARVCGCSPATVTTEPLDQALPWIVEAALKNREQQFTIHGEAVVLGVDGVSNFSAPHSRKHDHEAAIVSRERVSRQMPAFCAGAHALLAEAGSRAAAEELAPERGHSRMAIMLAKRFCR